MLALIANTSRPNALCTTRKSKYPHAAALLALWLALNDRIPYTIRTTTQEKNHLAFTAPNLPEKMRDPLWNNSRKKPAT